MQGPLQKQLVTGVSILNRCDATSGFTDPLLRGVAREIELLGCGLVTFDNAPTGPKPFLHANSTPTPPVTNTGLQPVQQAVALIPAGEEPPLAPPSTFEESGPQLSPPPYIAAPNSYPPFGEPSLLVSPFDPEPISSGPAQLLQLEIIEFSPYAPMHATIRVSLKETQAGTEPIRSVMAWDRFGNCDQKRRTNREPIQQCPPNADALSPRAFAAKIAHDIAGWHQVTTGQSPYNIIESGSSVPGVLHR